MFSRILAVLLATSLAAAAAEIKRIPPPGIAVPEADRAELQAGIDALGKEIAALPRSGRDTIADVQIFHKSADWALRYDEFFNEKQIAAAKAHLAMGMQRAKELREGKQWPKSNSGLVEHRKASWDTATGLVVRGYTSAIDGSVQPYGLVIPEDWKADDRKPRRLDFWLHGRGEQLSELAFIEDRLKNRGEFTPKDAIVCHLYGRFCNANKFAGERDLFEALDDIVQHYEIDAHQMAVRGFSMGGAACWQFATHHSRMWAAAAPGAGFAETAEFFRVFAPGKTPPPWWEQVLWRWYDSTTMAANLVNVPVVAYSGEIDGQKQAADMMVKYAKAEGIEFPHIIGPQMPHKYDAESKRKIDEQIDSAVEKAGAYPRYSPEKGHITTYTIMYPNYTGHGWEKNWFWIEALGKQWERADLDGEMHPGIMVFKTRNVTRFTVSYNASHGIPPQFSLNRQMEVDGQKFVISPERGSVSKDFLLEKGRWMETNFGALPITVRKTSKTCGPIDHAFMSPFLFVEPTGEPLNEAVGTWTKFELAHAKQFWRQVFRGDVRTLRDVDVNLSHDSTDSFGGNLVLWGDPSSNAVIRKIVGKLPIKWTRDTLEFNGVKYDAAHHAPILIFPNPLNPQKYIVLNSGPTFREEALLNNSDQTPKLPDWAIVNLDTPPDGKWPGQIIDAGFFDEQWSFRR